MTTGIKIEIGNRIREERERQGLTREQLCDTEEELTVKQLMRIELGRSLPTIVKLDYIGERLGINISDLLGQTQVTIPDDYYQVKYKLMKSPVYGDKKRIEEKQKAIDGIYEKYIDILPEDELLAIDIIERTLNFINDGEEDLVEIVFEDYFDQVLKRESYSLNDLLLIKYYAFQCQDIDYNQEIIAKLRRNLIAQRPQGEELINVELLGALSTIAGIYVTHHDYKDMKPVVDKMYDIISKTLQHAYQPAVLIFEAKYYLYEKEDFEKAKELYRTAMILAKNFGDKVFIKNLSMEMDKDLNEKNSSK